MLEANCGRAVRCSPSPLLSPVPCLYISLYLSLSLSVSLSLSLSLSVSLSLSSSGFCCFLASLRPPLRRSAPTCCTCRGPVANSGRVQDLVRLGLLGCGGFASVELWEHRCRLGKKLQKAGYGVHSLLPPQGHKRNLCHEVCLQRVHCQNGRCTQLCCEHIGTPHSQL